MKALITGIVIIFIAGFMFAEEDFTYDAKQKRDPFVPLVSEGGVYVSDAYGISGIKDIRLEGIVWDGTETSVAIINGEIIREGEVLGNVKVLKIEKSGVIFDIDGEEMRIELHSD